jgi:hypothetical protein
VFLRKLLRLCGPSNLKRSSRAITKPATGSCTGRIRPAANRFLDSGIPLAKCGNYFRAMRRLFDPILNLLLDKKTYAAQLGQGAILLDQIGYLFRL